MEIVENVKSESSAIRIKKVAILAGAMCAYWIGSGFTTGQEVLQFFAVNGLAGLGGGLIFLVMMGLFTYVLFTIGQKKQFKNPYTVFEYYCGTWLGKAYTWYNVVLIYAVFVVMLSGSGATIHQHFGVPSQVGTIIIGLLALGTAILGIEKLINIIGVIGPVKILFIVVIGIAAIVTAFGNPQLVLENSANMPHLGFEAASPSWAWSGALYAFGTLISGIPFVVDCGASAGSVREARVSAIAGTIAFTVAILLLTFAEVVYAGQIVGQQVPTLAIATYIAPILGLVFAVLIVIAIYSSVSSFLLMTVRNFAQDKTKKFYILTVVLAAIGIIFGGILPFDKLVNIIYPLAGYSAMLFVVIAGVKMVRDRSAAKG